MSVLGLRDEWPVDAANGKYVLVLELTTDKCFKGEISLRIRLLSSTVAGKRRSRFTATASLQYVSNTQANPPLSVDVGPDFTFLRKRV
jgi:hypothetical protein